MGTFSTKKKLVRKCEGMLTEIKVLYSLLGGRTFKEVLHRVAEVDGELRNSPSWTFSLREMLIMKTRGRATPQSKAENYAVILRGLSTSSLY